MHTHYQTKQKHRQNVKDFDALMSKYPWMKLSFPNIEKAPWHEQAVLTTDLGHSIILNFWPCSMTAQRDGEKSVKGYEAIRLMISTAIDDCRDKDDIVLTEEE